MKFYLKNFKTMVSEEKSMNSSGVPRVKEQYVSTKDLETAIVD